MEEIRCTVPEKYTWGEKEEYFNWRCGCCHYPLREYVRRCEWCGCFIDWEGVEDGRTGTVSERKV